ncbi:hypothetical protein FOMG_14742 [Fusarium oxysporum f. sp. melonis 26406]|uniref:Uncharacterized protein n=1 Tax=Fusarium oxysporum f. sp. melonis 26406 TaxID=1089452 RepID=W9ZKQ1_FUSOX|nr:hypothetical protein FOMG_14742 [Fusarium oxysporum f. sp. melonis 26406]
MVTVLNPMGTRDHSIGSQSDSLRTNDLSSVPVSWGADIQMDQNSYLPQHSCLHLGWNIKSLPGICYQHVSQGKWNWLSRSAQPLVDFDRFDTASRVAWGSLRLLQSCVRRPRWIAIGALTAIALLTFEPFTQAVLVITDKEVILDHREYNKVLQSSNGSLETHGNVPTIGRSTRLDGASWTGAFAGVGLVQFPGPNNTPMNFSVYRTSSNIQEDMGMKAAMWNGFLPFTARQNLKPAFACATGNCTWANFTSIAVCSKCRDISGYVTKSSGPVKLPSGI